MVSKVVSTVCVHHAKVHIASHGAVLKLHIVQVYLDPKSQF